MISKKISRICSAAAALVFTATTFGSYPSAFESKNAGQASAATVKYEFEDAKITGNATSVMTTESGYSGDGYVYLKDAGDTISFDINAPSAGMFDISMCYNLPTASGSKKQFLYINGENQGEISFTPNDKFSEVNFGAFKLKEGKNTIKIESSWGWTMLDYLTVEPAQLASFSASKELSDQKATERTKKLMSYLCDTYGKNIISGQQEYYGTSRADEFDYIYNISGEYPAIRGFDFGETCPLFAWDAGTSGRIIDWVNEKNGIATASWHVNVPTVMADYTPGATLDFSKSTYSEKTDFVTANVMKEGTAEHDYFLLCVKNLAAQLKKVQDADVPLIFRPFHEAEGNGGANGEGAWFWWSKEGAAVYKDLYRYLYDMLTNEYGLHNLIWEFNSYTYGTSHEWYPGKDYVDIVGYDKYNATNWNTGVIAPNTSAISSTFYSLVDMYNSDGKLIAMAENDTIPSVENLTAEKAGWLYFCPWYGEHLMDAKYNTKDSIKSIYQSDYVITLDEIPADLYGDKKTGDGNDDPGSDEPSGPSADGRYEFENGTLTGGGTTTIASSASASGGKYVYLQTAGDKVSFNVNAEKAGLYKIVIGYQQNYDKGGKIQNLIVNGSTAESVSFPYTEKFEETPGTIVSLKEGKNEVAVESSWGWTNLDYFTVTAAESVKVDATKATLSNANASEATKSLYKYICQMYGSGIISGQQESTWMTSPDYEMDYIYGASGKYPAMRGLDYMGDDFSGVNKRAKEWYEKGGIATICWHCGSDFSGNYDDSKADTLDWDKALTPGTAEYEALLKNMDRGAQALKELKDAGVPVIWRPFHEFDGGWFWWGKGGAENFKKLWKLMYDRYTNEWGLDNLIWSLGFTTSVPADWYPGDEYVDIVGADTYVESDGSLIGMYNKVVDLVGTDVPIILHENGAIPNPDSLESDGAYWSSFMTWHTEWITDAKWNTKESIKSVYTSDYVITLDELPDDLYTSAGTDTPGDTFMYGDVNRDKVIDLSDLVALSMHLLKDKLLTGDSLKAADCDGNGDVDIADLPLLKQYVMKDKITLGPKK